MHEKIKITKEQLKKHLKNHLSYKQIGVLYNCSEWTVLERAKKYGLKSNLRAYQQKMNNIAKDIQVRSKISESVKKKWIEGFYKDRINGMIGLTSDKHPNYKPSIHFRKKALFYNQYKCSICGEENKKIDIHHIDEDHNNYLLSNLEPLCVKCHQKYHYKKMKTPFGQVTKVFHFEASHFLPLHDKACKFLHGHSYKLEITVRRRIDKETGMVIDYSKLKDIVDRNVINVLDHSYLNELIPVSTTENICLWIWSALSKELKGLFNIKIWETEGSFSELTQQNALDFVREGILEKEWRK